MTDSQQTGLTLTREDVERAVKVALERNGGGSLIGGVQNHVTIQIGLSDKLASRLLDMIEGGAVALEVGGGRFGARIDNAKVLLTGPATINAESVRGQLRAADVAAGSDHG